MEFGAIVENALAYPLGELKITRPEVHSGHGELGVERFSEGYVLASYVWSKCAILQQLEGGYVSSYLCCNAGVRLAGLVIGRTRPQHHLSDAAHRTTIDCQHVADELLPQPIGRASREAPTI